MYEVLLLSGYMGRVVDVDYLDSLRLLVGEHHPWICLEVLFKMFRDKLKLLLLPLKGIFVGLLLQPALVHDIVVVLGVLVLVDSLHGVHDCFLRVLLWLLHII